MNNDDVRERDPTVRVADRSAGAAPMYAVWRERFHADLP